MPTSILESPSLLTLRIYGDDGGWLAVTRIERIPKPDEYGHDYGHIIHRVDYSHNHVGAWFEPGRLGKSLSSIADSSYSGENLIFFHRSGWGLLVSGQIQEIEGIRACGIPFGILRSSAGLSRF